MTAPGRPGPALPYRYLAGVEPCPGGWLVAAGRLQGTTLTAEDPLVLPTFTEVLDHRPAFEIVALHAPVGLLDEPTTGGRRCEREARRLLGWPRLASVMPSPCRPALGASTYREAATLNGGMSQVTWEMLGRCAQVDAEMQPYRQRSIFEVHPELSMLELNGGVAVASSRRTEEGRRERIALLEAKLPDVRRIVDARLRDTRIEHRIDAAADLWTARRIAARSTKRLPEDPEWDSEGLRMEIVY